MINVAAGRPSKINITDLGDEVRKLRLEKQAYTLLGSMLTTQGTLAVLFSHRYNEEYSFLIPGTDKARVLAIIDEALTPEPREMITFAAATTTGPELPQAAEKTAAPAGDEVLALDSNAPSSGSPGAEGMAIPSFDETMAIPSAADIGTVSAAEAQKTESRGAAAAQSNRKKKKNKKGRQ